MSESKYTKRNISVPDNLWQRASNAEGFNSASEYVRVMAIAGESNIAALDPRTGDEEGSTAERVENSEKLILEALDDEFQDFDTILKNAFNEVASDYLYELAKDDDSPVDKSGVEFRIKE